MAPQAMVMAMFMATSLPIANVMSTAAPLVEIAPVNRTVRTKNICIGNMCGDGHGRDAGLAREQRELLPRAQRLPLGANLAVGLPELHR